MLKLRELVGADSGEVVSELQEQLKEKEQALEGSRSRWSSAEARSSKLEEARDRSEARVGELAGDLSAREEECVELELVCGG